ncbi:hypothetical protein [Streptomyces sp. NPDC005525]|uniref:hypothetical protein n=1 Tax=Streptomyces sp. NPDC005525 TaxID=3364720 RepID=UPI003680AA94
MPDPHKTTSPDGTDQSAPWWLREQPQDPLAGGADGCCSSCPVRTECGVANDAAENCAVTGHQPSPAQPSTDPATTGWDVTEVASRGVESAISGLFGFDWADMAALVIERTNRFDADGDPVDWGRLQIKRNLLCIALATLVPMPIDGTTPARWVANALNTGGVAYAVIAPAGAMLCVAGSIWLGTLAPGVFGGLCRLCLSVTTAAGRAWWKFARSGLGWIITRPAIWAAACGILIVSWDAIVHTLTGA